MEDDEENNRYVGFWDTTPEGYYKVGAIEEDQESEVSDLDVMEICAGWWERLKMWLNSITHNATKNTRKET